MVVTLARNPEALDSIGVPGTAPTRWRLPGVAGYTDQLGTLPDARVLTVLAEMASVTNLLDESVAETPPGAYVMLRDIRDSSPPRFVVIANAPGEARDDTAARSLALRMARAALAAGIPAFQLSVTSWDGEMILDARFHVGECTETIPASAADRRLLADLQTDGLLLQDATPGACITWATP